MQTPFSFIGRISRRTLIAGLGAVVLTGGLVAGTAFAADPTPTPKTNTYFQDFVSKLAAKLGKSEADVNSALAATQKDFVDQAVKDGKLAPAAADKLKERLAQGPFPFKPYPQVGPIAKARAARAIVTALADETQIAATYLGLPVADLRAQLQKGSSLADIAAAQKKDVAGLKTALTANATKKLNDAAAAGKITADQKTKLQAQIDKRVDALINRKADPSKQRRPGLAKPTATPAPQS